MGFDEEKTLALFDELLERISCKEKETLKDELTEKYSEPKRAYHNLKHIVHYVQKFEDVKIKQKAIVSFTK